MTDLPTEIVEAAERLVLQMLPRRASAEHLALTIGVKTADLQLAFRRVRGVSLYNALLQLRLMEVDRLIRNDSELSAQVAAAQCGFGHYGVFHRTFRTLMGREPGAAPAAKDLEPAHLKTG